MDLPRSHSAAGIGRRALRRLLAEADAYELVRDAELALSELVTQRRDAHVAARCSSPRGSTATHGVLRVAVSDDDPRPPVARRRSRTRRMAERGLQIVGAVTTSWGVDDTPATGDGKTIWFELRQYRPAGRRIA